MGNPVTDWEPWQDYVVCRLPQLLSLDGKEITRSTRILAKQGFERAEKELRRRAKKERVRVKPPPEENEYCPELRNEMYREEAEEKAAQEKSKDHMKVPERDYSKEHKEQVAAVREEEEGATSRKERVKQCNQGRYEFRMYEEGKEVVIEVDIPRFMSTAFVDVDSQPTFVSIVIKKKVLRLELPVECNPDRGTCQRSSTTGCLTVRLPRVDEKNVIKAFVDVNKEREAKRREADRATRTTRIGEAGGPMKMADQLLAAQQAGGGAGSGGAGAPAGAVRLQGIAKGKGAVGAAGGAKGFRVGASELRELRTVDDQGHRMPTSQAAGGAGGGAARAAGDGTCWDEDASSVLDTAATAGASSFEPPPLDAGCPPLE
jgi:protein TilB